MATNIKCPKCSHEFEATDAFREEVQRELNSKAKEWQSKKEEEFRQKEQSLQAQLAGKDAEFNKKLAEEKQRQQEERIKLENQLQEQIRKSIAQDFENQLRILKEAEKEKDEKLKVAQQKELTYLRKEKELEARENELELALQKRLLEEKQLLLDQVRKEEEQRLSIKDEEHKFKVKDLEMQLEEQKRLIEEMKRRAEQGSMQRQGEVQELLLEELLKEHFPFDVVSEVGKGVEGADCIQTVRNHLGNDCGNIIFESKRTKTFNSIWIDKLKADMRSKGADIAILVSQAYPKEMNCFGEKDGVWICSFSEVIALTTALRHTIIRVADTKRFEENKGEKMTMLYTYLTGNEFRQTIETIVEGFLSMKNSISKEKIQMEKIWKEREKQLEKVLLSTSGLYGSIKGIAGSSIGNIPLLEDGIEEEEDNEAKLIAG
jgi:hypothetical protein